MAPRYTIDELIALRESPLVHKPEELPSIEAWIDQSAEREQSQPNQQNTNTNTNTRNKSGRNSQNGQPSRDENNTPMGSFASTSRPSLLNTRHTSRSSVNPASGMSLSHSDLPRVATNLLRTLQADGLLEDIVLGPPKTTFASSRSISNKLHSESAEKLAPTTEDALEEDAAPATGRTRYFRDKTGHPTSVPLKSASDRWRGGRKPTEEEDRNTDTQEEPASRRNAGFGGRSDQRWSRDGDTRPPNKLGEGQRGGWRDRERARQETGHYGGREAHNEKDPEWMDEPADKDDTMPQMKTVDDFEKWKESMKRKSNPPAADNKEDSVTPDFMATPMRSTAASNTPATPVPQQDPGFGAMFGTWGESRPVESPAEPAPKQAKAPATGKAKSSRFASMFAPKDEPRQQEESAPASPSIFQQAAAANGSSEDKEGFARILAMLGGKPPLMSPANDQSRGISSPAQAGGLGALFGAAQQQPQQQPQQQQQQKPSNYAHPPPQDAVAAFVEKKPSSARPQSGFAYDAFMGSPHPPTDKSGPLSGPPQDKPSKFFGSHGSNPPQDKPSQVLGPHGSNPPQDKPVPFSGPSQDKPGPFSGPRGSNPISNAASPEPSRVRSERPDAASQQHQQQPHPFFDQPAQQRHMLHTPESLNVQQIVAGGNAEKPRGALNKDSEFLLKLINNRSAVSQNAQVSQQNQKQQQQQQYQQQNPAQNYQARNEDNFQLFLDQPPPSSQRKPTQQTLETHAPKPQQPHRMPGALEEQLFKGGIPHMNMGPQPNERRMDQPQPRGQQQRVPPGFFEDPAIMQHQQQQHQQLIQGGQARRHSQAPPQPQPGLPEHMSFPGPPPPGYNMGPGPQQQGGPGAERGMPQPPPGFNPNMRHPPGFAGIPGIFQAQSAGAPQPQHQPQPQQQSQTHQQERPENASTFAAMVQPGLLARMNGHGPPLPPQPGVLAQMNGHHPTGVPHQGHPPQAIPGMGLPPPGFGMGGPPPNMMAGPPPPGFFNNMPPPGFMSGHPGMMGPPNPPGLQMGLAGMNGHNGIRSPIDGPSGFGGMRSPLDGQQQQQQYGGQPSQQQQQQISLQQAQQHRR